MRAFVSVDITDSMVSDAISEMQKNSDLAGAVRVENMHYTLMFLGQVEDSKMGPNLIVCLTGMPGAGKSTIANGLKSQGFDVVVMGNAVRSEADKRNLEHNRENLASLMVTLRASDGPAAIAHLVEPEIQNATSNTVIVDGVRSDDEIAFFETICTTKILSVHASKDTRFNYMTNRGRSDDPQNKSKFTERDTKEINVGISRSIALADESISNNNLTIDELVKTAYNVIDSWRQ